MVDWSDDRIAALSDQDLKNLLVNAERKSVAGVIAQCQAEIEKRNAARPRKASKPRTEVKEFEHEMSGQLAAIGKAILAFCDEPAAAAVLGAGLSRVSERTVTSAELLRSELDRIRDCGLAYDLEESRPGLVCVASPVHGPGGTAAGALSVSGWSTTFKADRVAPAVRTAALTISRALGARVVPAAGPSRLAGGDT